MFIFGSKCKFQRPPRGSKIMNPEDDLSMEILRRSEKLATETYPETLRDHNKVLSVNLLRIISNTMP